ncbi:MAG: GTP-binding protein Obg/CgtA [Solirubrobacterales bacterium]|nr:GTP-binding protein Obg/CgtA [Solirubrobacterales bacterium]
MRDLQTFKRKALYKATAGTHGQGSNRIGAEGPTLEIAVPPGTVVTHEDGTVHDLVRPGQRVIVARGGPYGRGNKRFATAVRQAPKFREFGLAGEEAWLELQLKLLADVGLVGLPNAGKSSLLKRLTRADPKIGSYPFTTLEPHLGTIERDGRQLILADIPGLIEGASDGAGLGHDFLAHVERTRLLVHVLDLAPLDGTDPGDNHALIEAELAAYDARLAALPRVLALSKSDLVPDEDAQAAVELWREELGDDIPILVTSSATGQGLDELVFALFERVPVLEALPEPIAAGGDEEALAEHQTFRPVAKRGYSIEQIGPNAYRVVGEGIERMLARYDAENDEAMGYLEHRLSRIGVIRALEDAGFQHGDEVHIGDVVLELDED